jgi:hypothetical protein
VIDRVTVTGTVPWIEAAGGGSLMVRNHEAVTVPESA